MRRKRFSPEQISRILQEAELGTTIKDLCRKHGIAEQTFFSWRNKYGGMGVNEALRLKALEEENRKLKRLVADLSLNKQVLQDLIEEKF